MKLVRPFLCSALLTSVAAAEEVKQANDTPAFGIVANCDLTGYESVSQTGLAVAVPDNNATGVTLGPIVLPPGSAITDVVVGLNMTHTWVGDLRVIVSYDETCDGPIDAQAVLLCRPRGTGADTPAPCGVGMGFGCSADLTTTSALLWDDTAAAPIAEGTCPDPIAAGCYRPSSVGGGQLSIFEGMRKDGCWYLQVIDHATGDFGLIQSWSVHVLSNSCACPALPPADEAAFKVGTPVFVAPDLFDVPLLVSTPEDATYTQMTIKYDSTCLTYVPTMSVVGGDVTNPGTPFIDDALVGGTTRHVLLNMDGQYTGCDQEVFILRFQLTGSAPCGLTWDRTPGGPNSNCHLNYDIPPGDGKIMPDDISFCDGTICDPNVTIAGTVEYYSNGTPIIADRPTMSSAVAPTVEDCGDQNPTTTATSPNADYSLLFGAGPQAVAICAQRPRAVCGTNEDGVISGDDVIALQNDISPPPPTTDPKRIIAGDVNRDGILNATDVIGIKRWIARKVCDGTDACGGAFNNCSGTWRFLFFTNSDPSIFQADQGDLGFACDDRTVPIEGILVGDFDGSWPNIFNPKASSVIDLALDVRLENGAVAVALRADLDAGESLRHIIYSLSYDPGAFEYLGMQPGSGAANWDGLDNPDVQGEAHGIAHIPPQTAALAQSGEVVVFRFRPRHSEARSVISFTRMKANDIDVEVPDLEITSHGEATTVTTPLPTRYSIASHPNPFNPRTRVTYTIPAGAERVPVELRIFDIAGRLVRTLERTERGPGQYAIDWDGKNDAGSSAGTGIYMLSIRAGEWSEVEKLTLVK